ncbi:hypothetical protein NUW58_g3822 [Xylaria curta]|uniref:Uncharacterized protein n=1 Tax=Xylaria curta TaxID=42375 RepID=A0ACC1PAP9_9PEZI|nr:hypothetical protein NUW58_g3822 [Xylaria curta]
MLNLRFQFLLLLCLGTATSLTAAASAPLFCKCTCLKNSTLIQLSPQSSCTQCTHAFCLSQNLPICKDATENNVFSTCIQRDSRKDQIIVWGFLLGTAGLLGWAALKRIEQLREGKTAAQGLGTARLDTQNRAPYAPIPGAMG